MIIFNNNYLKNLSKLKIYIFKINLEKSLIDIWFVNTFYNVKFIKFLKEIQAYLLRQVASINSIYGKSSINFIL
jgi:hypothetical protein